MASVPLFLSLSAAIAAISALAAPAPSEFSSLVRSALNTSATSNTTESVIAAANTITGQAATLGVLSIITGFFVLFAGYRLLRPTLFLAGFVILGTIGYIILINSEPATGYANRDTVLLLGPLAFAFVGGFLALFFWRVGISALGLVGGLGFAFFILSWKSGGVIQSEAGRAIFITICALIGGILIHIVAKPAIIATSSIGGSYLVIFGIDMFAKTGVATAIRTFFSKPNSFDGSNFNTTPGVFALLSTMIVLSIIGIVTQFHTNRGRSGIFGEK